MSTVMYDTLDSQLARPAHPTYDAKRERFFSDHKDMAGISASAEVLADAERYAEQQGWAVKWERGTASYQVTAQLRDRQGAVIGAVSGIDSTVVDARYARLVEAYLAARAVRGPSVFMTGGPLW